MIAYRKERIENTLLYFSQEHYQKTGEYLTPEALCKYLALFEFEYLKETGDMPLDLGYRAMKEGPLPIEFHINRNYYQFIRIEPYRTKESKITIIKPSGVFDSDYFADAEQILMKRLVAKYGKKFVIRKIGKDTSHTSIKAWKIAFEKEPNSRMNPADEFERPPETMLEEEMNTAELRYKMNTQIRDFCLHPTSTG